MEQRRAVVLAREAKERMHREREYVAARDRHLNMLAKRQTDAWRRIDALVVTKRPGDYDAAITLLKDLREIAERKDGLWSSPRASMHYVRRTRRSQACSRVSGRQGSDWWLYGW